jgi:hypothetical protein
MLVEVPSIVAYALFEVLFLKENTPSGDIEV